MGLHTLATSYIPNPDPEALLWMENFRGHVELKAGSFGIEAGEAASLAGLIRDFSEKLAVVFCESTRTGPAITAKIEARNAATLAIQAIVRVIKANPAVPEHELIQLGLPLPRQRRREVPVPTTSPLLNVVAGLDGSHALRMSDSLTPDSRRKPDGVMHMQLYVAVGPADAGVVSDPGLATFHSLVTKNPFSVKHDPANNGKTATYFGRWSTRTGLTGPWSLPVGMTITFVVRGG